MVFSRVVHEQALRCGVSQGLYALWSLLPRVRGGCDGTAEAMSDLGWLQGFGEGEASCEKRRSFDFALSVFAQDDTSWAGEILWWCGQCQMRGFFAFGSE
jgi:hypothetical protein